MQIKKHIVFYFIFFIPFFGVFGQSKIEGDLLILSELTLIKSPLIQRNALEIDLAEANFKAHRSVFDYQLSSGINLSMHRLSLFDADPRSKILFKDLDTKNRDLSIGLQKKFTTGLLARVSSNYTSVTDNFPLNDFNEEVGANISDQTTSATLYLSQPLLRGNGVKVNEAFIKSAALEIESANQTFELNVAFEILRVGIAFWEYVSAYKSLEIYRENEARVRNVLGITIELVKADEKTESDLVQIHADLAQKERQTAVTEQNLINARVKLGMVVGIDERESQSIDDPIHGFPTIVGSGYSQEINLGKMTELARINRSDIKANQNNQQALELQLTTFRNATLPQLDLEGYVTYGGAAVGGGLGRYFEAFGNQQGRNHGSGLGLAFSFPINNNLAKANLAKGKIALTDQKIGYQDLLRNIDLNVSIALNNLNYSVVILEKAKETLNYSQQVFNNEEIKFQHGLTTLLNLIILQERLTFAQLDHLQAQLQFAQAIIELRYATGTLVSVDREKKNGPLDRQLFYTIPIATKE